MLENQEFRTKDLDPQLVLRALEGWELERLDDGKVTRFSTKKDSKLPKLEMWLASRLFHFTPVELRRGDPMVYVEGSVHSVEIIDEQDSTRREKGVKIRTSRGTFFIFNNGLTVNQCDKNDAGIISTISFKGLR